MVTDEMIANQLVKEYFNSINYLGKSSLAVGGGGNFSVRFRLATKDIFLIKVSGKSFSEITREDVVSIDLNGLLLDQEAKPSRDTNLHALIYRNCLNIWSILHLHCPYATAYALLKKDLPMITKTALDKLQKVPVVDEDAAELLLRSISQGCSAVLLKDHGFLTVASSPFEAIKIAELVEETAKTSFLYNVFRYVLEQLQVASMGNG